MASFDWYQATIPAPVDDVLEVLCQLDDRVSLRHSKGLHGYGTSTSLEGSQGRLGQVWHGGTHHHPHVVFSSENAQPGAELIRVHYPQHQVTRADACEDFSDPEAFDLILPVMLGAATAHRVKVDTRGDHLLTMKGRTVYLGSSASACRQRLYDKAAELRAKHAADPVRLLEVPDYLTRLEAQVRPQTASARALFASIEPMAVMGSSAWLRTVWEGVSGQKLTPVHVGKPWRQSDDDRAYAYLLAQYGGLLQRRQQELGSWDCVGLQLGHDLAERAKAIKRGPGR